MADTEREGGLLALLDELRTIASNGLYWTDSPYDEERYERILDLVSEHYGEALDRPPEEVRERLAAGLGQVTPNVGGRAAIFDREDRILLVKRANDGTWGLPGGFTDPGEHPRETAVREAREETGLDVEPVDLALVQARAAGEHNPHGFVGHVYLCETLEESEASHAHEVDAVEYRDVEDVTAWHADHGEAARRARAAWREWDVASE